ncbi:MAG: pantetheine-phosphate adenylyltransferase [Candidatus Ratteibacteria bacterium]|jgi:pantetheine-phosphate adenylyltransferase
MKTAVYPGSFDPVTNGHIEIVERSQKFIECIIIAVAHNPQKKSLFSFEERAEMLKEVFKDYDNVRVESFDGLLVDYLRRKKVSLVIRGLRAVSDFDYEFQMALTNRQFMEEVETIFLMPREEYLYLSSSMVRQIAQFHGSIKKFVPEIVAQRLREKFT